MAKLGFPSIRFQSLNLLCPQAQSPSVVASSWIPFLLSLQLFYLFIYSFTFHCSWLNKKNSPIITFKLPKLLKFLFHNVFAYCGYTLLYYSYTVSASGKEAFINACGLSAMFSQNSENSLNTKKRKKKAGKILLVINRDLRRRAFVESEKTGDF